MFDEKTINEFKVYLKGRKILNDEEVDAIKDLIMADYNAQKKQKVEDRRGYFSHEGADYLIFKTDDEAIPDLKNKGKYLNDIKITKNSNWQYWARFPLKTSESASSPARVTIFDEYDEVISKNGKEVRVPPKWCKLKMIVAAKGRMNEKYKLIGSKDFAKPLKDFVAEYNEKCKEEFPPDEQENYQYLEFSEIDKSDYIINYTFNLDQVLEMKSLK
jgi:hypothetical protein